jgi:hypothetical protein
MVVASQIGTTVSKRDTLGDLVAGLRDATLVLCASIEVEEDRTKLRDQNDHCYSPLARSMRARLDNLRITIAMLEAKSDAA